jgi:hypothetical protein
MLVPCVRAVQSHVLGDSVAVHVGNILPQDGFGLGGTGLGGVELGGAGLGEERLSGLGRVGVRGAGRRLGWTFACVAII